MDRQLVTILAADAVGYSKLMANDEHGAYEALSHSRSIVDRIIELHNGKVFGSAGDSVLAEFRSSVNAVQCAIDIQQQLADERRKRGADQLLNFRIGINFGDVIVESDNLLGDGVNVAARLEALAPTNGICVAANVMEQVRGKIESSFGYAGKHRLKNIEHPLEVWCWPENEAAVLKRTAVRRSITLVPLLVIAVAAMAWLAYTYLFSNSTSPSQPGTARIAVLPFTNISQDKEQEYFVDGITSDLITDLSKISALFVISRNSAFAYKGRSANTTKVAQELGVRYLLEGSVRSAGERVRVNARLIDSQSDGQIWAERFDRKMGDIFALQDEITNKIVAALELRLTRKDKAQVEKPKERTTAEAYDLYLRGFRELRQFSIESTRSARVYFLKSLALDPNYARAHSAVAFTYVSSSIFFSSGNSEEATLQALSYGTRSLQLDPSLPQSHFSVAVAYLRRGQHQKALMAARASVIHDPNYSDGYAILASILGYEGNGDEAESSIRRAMLLNPRYSAAYIDILGRAQFAKGDNKAAIENFQKCIERDSSALTCRLFLAAALSLIGRQEDAEWQAQEILGQQPKFRLSTNSVTPQFRRPKDRDRILSLLRKVGLPE